MWPSGKVEFKGDPIQRTILSVSFRFERHSIPSRGRCCEDAALLKQARKALLKSGLTIMEIDDNILVLNESDADRYKMMAQSGAKVYIRKL